MKTWTYALIGGLAALVVVAGVGGYLLGNRHGRVAANDIRSRFLAERLGTQSGQAGQAFPGGFRAAGGLGGGGTMGTVQSVDGNTIVVTTNNGDVQVQVGDSTTVQKMAGGTLQDVQPGERIIVAGQADTAGRVTAQSIQLMPAPGQ